MPSYYLTPISSIFQFFSDQGVVLSGGKVNTYLAGTSTPQVTKTDITGSVSNSNPIILNSAGRLPNVQVWQQGGLALKVIVTDSNNVQVGPVFDQLSGINDPAGLLAPFSNPASGSGADLIANAMRSYDIFSSVRAAVTPSFQAGQTLIIDVQGGSSINDGIGGLFYWNASSTASDDNQNVLKLAAAATGRFIRLGYIVPNGMVSYDIFSSVRTAVAPVMASGQTLIIQTEGAGSIGDNLGGHFYWAPGSVAADDNANVLKPNSVSGAGRYLRIFEPISNAQVSLGAITQYFAQTLSGNGYTTLPNGLIIEWGSLSKTASVQGTSVTFPLAFPTACFGVTVARTGSTPTNDIGWEQTVGSITTSGFVVNSCDFGAGAPDGTTTVYWHALGH